MLVLKALRTRKKNRGHKKGQPLSFSSIEFKGYYYFASPIISLKVFYIPVHGLPMLHFILAFVRVCNKIKKLDRGGYFTIIWYHEVVRDDMNKGTSQQPGMGPLKHKIVLHLNMIHPHLSALATDLSWNDLLLDKETLKQVEGIKTWLKHSSPVNLDKSPKKKLKAGYRALFNGPSGTEKTLTAALIGKEFNKPVFKIDLSMLVSEYTGETEKNLESLFASAKDKGWILFFDEADALFGKRTEPKDSHDRYANQEVSWLLQRMEDYNGLAILATNMKGNIDDAFTRRFNSILRFHSANLDVQ